MGFNQNEDQQHPHQEIDFFAALMYPSHIKFIFFFCSFVLIIVGIPGFYSIIWFEKYGSNKKRTILNKLVAVGCWNAIQFCLFIQIPEMIRFMNGPQPIWLCFIKQILRSAIFTQILFILDAIAIAKYIYVFCLKNPAGFQDSFWCVFTGIWITVAGSVSQTAWHMLALRQPINYYICSGLDPTKDFKVKFEIYGVVEIVSIILHIVVHVRVHLYKEKKTTPMSIYNEPFQKMIKFDGETLPVFITNVINILVLGVSTIIMVKISTVPPEYFNVFPIDVYVMCSIFFLPALAGILCIVMYFCNHKPLRRDVMAKLIDMIEVNLNVDVIDNNR